MKNRVQCRADCHPHHLAGPNFPGGVVARGIVDDKCDQQADHHEDKTKDYGCLIDREIKEGAFLCLSFAKDEHDQGKKQQNNAQCDYNVRC